MGMKNDRDIPLIEFINSCLTLSGLQQADKVHEDILPHTIVQLVEQIGHEHLKQAHVREFEHACKCILKFVRVKNVRETSTHSYCCLHKFTQSALNFFGIDSNALLIDHVACCLQTNECYGILDPRVPLAILCIPRCANFGDFLLRHETSRARILAEILDACYTRPSRHEL